MQFAAWSRRDTDRALPERRSRSGSRADNSATGKKYQGFHTLKQANAYTKDMMIFADNWKHPGNTDSNGVKGPWNLSETGYYSFGRYGAHKTKTVISKNLYHAFFIEVLSTGK